MPVSISESADRFRFERVVDELVISSVLIWIWTLIQLCSPVCKMQQRGSSGYEWNTFVRVSLRLEPRSRKVLEKLSSAARYAFNSLF